MEVSGQTVRLGIAAPEGLPIYREEIWLAVKEENRAAAAAADELAGTPDSSQAGSALPVPAESESSGAPATSSEPDGSAQLQAGSATPPALETD